MRPMSSAGATRLHLFLRLSIKRRPASKTNARGGVTRSEKAFVSQCAPEAPIGVTFRQKVLRYQRTAQSVLNRGVGRPLKVPPPGRGRHCRPRQELAAGPGSKSVNSKIASQRKQRPTTLPRDRRENELG